MTQNHPAIPATFRSGPSAPPPPRDRPPRPQATDPAGRTAPTEATEATEATEPTEPTERAPGDAPTAGTPRTSKDAGIAPPGHRATGRTTTESGVEADTRATGQPGTDPPRGAPVAATAARRTPVRHTPRTPAGTEPRGGASPARGAEGGTLPAPPLPLDERRRLLDGAHHDPHRWLGAHPGRGGVTFRALRPYARAVTVVGRGLSAPLHHDGDGLFSGTLPLGAIPEYRLLVRYGPPDTVGAPDGANVGEHDGKQVGKHDGKHDGEHNGAPGPKPSERTGRTAPADTDELEIEDPYRLPPALGEFDLHLISEGRHEQLWRALGARPMRHHGVTGTRFTVWAPHARGVRVAGEFSYWDSTAFPMRSLGSSGVWELFIPDVGPGTRYKFDIATPDGGHTLRADPMARSAECPPATASVVHTSSHVWQDADWLARRAEGNPHREPMSIYEVHLPSWRPGLTYRELAAQLPAYVRDLGFTHVELMPCQEHPYGASWGYQITGYYAPTARLGSPDDFKFLVDALHQAGIGVLMDWVPAHFPKDSWALAGFDGTTLYEHGDSDRAEHPDWGTLEFDLGRREVRNFLVANAVYWCEEFHIDGLRVDAVASLLYLDYSREEGRWTPNAHGGREDLDAVAFLQEMNATLYRRCPGVLTAAEESTAWDGVTRATHHDGPGGFGGLGFGFKWNMGWMHDTLSYLSKEPAHRRHHHGEMTFSMIYAYSENYILPISHDEVVHGKRSLVSKAPGDWWQQRANHRAYLGFMWAHPGKQLLFMGQEFAQGAEWAEGHGPDWWLLDPSYAAEPDHRGVRELVRDLNTTYRNTPALWAGDTEPSGFSWIDADAADDNVFAFLRSAPGGEALLAVSNFSPVVRENYRLGVPDSAPVWREVLNTDSHRYGGGGVATASLHPHGGGTHGHRTGSPAPHHPVGTGQTGTSGYPPRDTPPARGRDTGHHGTRSDSGHHIPTEPVAAHDRPASLTLTLPPLATVWLRPS